MFSKHYHTMQTILLSPVHMFTYHYYWITNVQLKKKHILDKNLYRDEDKAHADRN